jgi:hypothetical protein
VTEEEFNELRPSAFAIAYRMLGSVSEAEDVVASGSPASRGHSDSPFIVGLAAFTAVIVSSGSP